MLKKHLLPIIMGLLSFLSIFGLNVFTSIFNPIPNIVFAPIFILAYSILLAYIKFIFNANKLNHKAIAVVINGVAIVYLIKFGFYIWKFQQGNLIYHQQAFFTLNLSNISFWIQFQSIIILLAINSLKTMVTIDQKN